MTLTTHAVVGATIASTMPSHPVLGFALAFTSHFLLDAIPHWDYSLNSHVKDDSNHLNDNMQINKNFFFDLIKIGIDMLLGFLLVLFIFALHGSQLTWIPLIGLVGGVLPDLLQFIYMKYHHEPLTSLQRFHHWIHAKERLNNKPFIGVSMQIFVILIAIFVFKYYII